MGILAKIFGALGSQAFSALLAPVMDVAKAFLNKEISEAEAAQRLASTIVEWAGKVEIEYAHVVGQTFESFQQTMRQSVMVQRAWCFLFYSETFVLVWHQFGIPFLMFFFYPKLSYPSSGSTVEWAYLLLGFMLGASSVMMRQPGTGILQQAGGLLRAIRGR